MIESGCNRDWSRGEPAKELFRSLRRSHTHGICSIPRPAGSVRAGEWTDDGIEFANRSYDSEDISVLPLSDPEKVVAVGRNYAKHADERGEDVPNRPTLFLKPPNTHSAGKERVD